MKEKVYFIGRIYAIMTKSGAKNHPLGLWMSELVPHGIKEPAPATARIKARPLDWRTLPWRRWPRGRRRPDWCTRWGGWLAWPGQHWSWRSDSVGDRWPGTWVGRGSSLVSTGLSVSQTRNDIFFEENVFFLFFEFWEKYTTLGFVGKFCLLIFSSPLVVRKEKD